MGIERDGFGYDGTNATSQYLNDHLFIHFHQIRGEDLPFHIQICFSF